MPSVIAAMHNIYLFLFMILENKILRRNILFSKKYW